ncbi:universal stress protein [Nitrosomonas sp. Nm166]|uniref:universal stress protein n=1 Tax=Nitrosomonas sp. Nm166 TaxID=1881054 RepID=UPI00210F151A|nr:universal stress protein [Nitrosomonas sp. Nm166]
MLIPLDGSELAEQVIPHLLRFVAPERTELLLMTALSSFILPSLKNAIRPLASEQTAISHEDEVSERLLEVAQQLNQNGFRVESKCLAGIPAESILRLAEEAYVNLIAMSTHGRTGLGLTLLGSVADEVVRNARPPVFLVPARIAVQSDSLPRTILLPLDGTPLAEAAIPAARQFAQDMGAMIRLVRVVDPYDAENAGDGLTTGQVFSDLDNTEGQPIIRQAVCYLERIRLRLQLAGITCRYHVTAGGPADSIVRIAHAESADLIVMSTHGRTGVERMVYGSVVSQVISTTTCPLLLMRGKALVEAYERGDNAVFAKSSG